MVGQRLSTSVAVVASSTLGSVSQREGGDRRNTNYLHTHTANLLFGGATPPDSKRARRAPRAHARASSRLFAPHARPRRQCRFDSGAAACGRTRSRRACGGRQPHTSRTRCSGSARSTACGANAPPGFPGPLGALSALSVDAPVGAPPERERKRSHSTPPSRDERRRRVTTVSWRTAACQPPDLPRL